MGTIPQQLNWVERRAACTVAKVFSELCDAIEDDVFQVNTIMGNKGDDVILAQFHPARTMIYVGSTRMPRAKAMIGIDQNRISVRQEWSGGEQWSVTVGLNDEGRCTLRLEDGKELEQWQFRKRALEGLFFASLSY